MRDGKLVHFSPSNRIQGSTYNGDGRRIYQAPDFALDLITDVSANDGKDWNEGGSMFPLKAFQGYNFLTGYMDAVVLDDGRVLCVTEGGAVVPYEGLIRFIYP